MNGKDFAKITKLEITFLVDLVAIAGFFSNPFFSSRILTVIPLLIAGTLASMSAALFNNIYDMDIDGEMRRTSYRGNLVNSKTYNVYFASGVLMLAVSMATSLVLVTVWSTVFIFLGFLSYVFLYTIFLKRRTTWNIVIGGIAGSFPALAGWAAVSGTISATSVFIAFIVFLWTPTHFWSLASGNTEDYRNAGVPMLPSVVGIPKSARYILINTVILVAYSIIPLFIRQINVGIAYYLMAIVLGVLMLYYSVQPLRKNFSKDAYKKAFHFSNYYLLILLVSICLVNIVH